METLALATGAPAASTARAVTRTTPRPMPYLIDPILIRPGSTVTEARPETVPAVATTVPVPPRTPAVNVLVAPAAGESIPRNGGVTDQSGAASTAFPNASTAD